MSAPAHATASSSDIVTTKVDIRDLQTAHGVKRVYSKLSRKADESCGVDLKASLTSRVAARECAESLLESFVADLDHDSLTTYYNRVTTHS